MNLNELKQERGQAITALRAIQDKADKEKRSLTAEETSAWEEADKKQEELRGKIESADKEDERRRRLERYESESRSYTPAPIARPGDATAQPAGGESNRSAEIRKLINEYCLEGRGVFYRPEFRALQADVVAQGGQIRIPEEFNKALIKSIDDSVFIRALATKYTVTTADSLGTPSLDNDPADASWTAEIGAFSEDSTMSFGKRELKPHLLTKGMKVSMKLLRVGALDPMQLVLDRLQYKFGITQEKNFLTGTGAGQPMGVFTASTDGIPTTRDVSTDNTSSAFTGDGLINALYSLKEGYQRGASWIFHRDAVKMARKLKDATNGQYLWQPGLSGFGITALNEKAGGTGDTILGKPLYMSEYAPSTFTTGLYVGIIGDFSYYWIADALTLAFQRLDELFAANNQVGFIGRMEADGMPVLGEAFARVKLG